GEEPDRLRLSEIKNTAPCTPPRSASGERCFQVSDEPGERDWYDARQPAIRLRLYRDRLRFRRQRGGSPPYRQGLQSCRHRNGPALDSTDLTAHQLVHSSLVLASQSWPARFFQYAMVPARHHLSWVCGGRGVHYVCRNLAGATGEGVGLGFLE